MSEAAIQTASSGDTVWIKVKGRATLQVSPALEECVRQFTADKTPHIILDLSECEWMDSTFAGCVVTAARECESAGHTDFQISGPSGDCQGLLHQMHIDTHLSIREEPAPPELNWQDYSCSSVNAEEMAKLVIKAHEELAKSDPDNAEFAKVAQAFKKDHKRRKEQ